MVLYVYNVFGTTVQVSYWLIIRFKTLCVENYSGCVCVCFLWHTRTGQLTIDQNGKRSVTKYPLYINNVLQRNVMNIVCIKDT